MDKEEEIRPADKVKTEKLLDDNFYFNCNDSIDYNSDIDFNLDFAIEMSKNEFNLLQERTLQEQLLQEQKERQLNFHNIKIQLNRIISFDRTNFRYYELILSIIDMYEVCMINEYETDEKEYNNIFNFLKTIRLSNEEIEKLKKIIIYE